MSFAILQTVSENGLPRTENLHRNRHVSGSIAEALGSQEAGVQPAGRDAEPSQIIVLLA